MPATPGSDYMGVIPHYHIDNQRLDEVEQEGVGYLW